MSWTRTVVGFWIGALLSGAAVFGVIGLIGELLGLDEVSRWWLLLVLAAAAVADLSGAKPPGPKRQVDENWLGAYRDWVIGLGYGLQLGAGYLTIISSFGTWALLVVALMSGLPAAIWVGLAFGLGRSLLLIATRDVRTPSSLASLMQRFSDAENLARWGAAAGYALMIVIVGLDAT
jgi:hypothetical protein